MEKFDIGDVLRVYYEYYRSFTSKLRACPIIGIGKDFAAIG